MPAEPAPGRSAKQERMPDQTGPLPDTLKVAVTCAHIAEERLATGITVLRVDELTTIADWFVIATGRARRQLQAIADAIGKAAKQENWPMLGIEGRAEASWILIDLGDVLVHLFNTEARQLYDLDLLWGDAPQLEWCSHTPVKIKGAEST